MSTKNLYLVGDTLVHFKGGIFASPISFSRISSTKGISKVL
jgi:hypothetical protein